MSSSILNIGVQALNANQTALSYVGQNIANVNTEGYSRQTVQMGTQDPPIMGVEVKDIRRITDSFLVRQLWSDTSALNSNQAFSEKIALLDKMLVSESTSLSASMDSYFTSLQQVVDDPLFIANRELFLAEAKTLTNAFTDFDAKLREQGDLINTELRSMASTVNSITRNIAELNVQIGTLDSSGQNANELKDKRDLLVKELSQYMSVEVIEQNGGASYNVMMGQGQPLVVGSSAARLELRNSESDPSQLDIYMVNGNIQANVSGQLGQGKIGGLQRYQEEVLNPTINEVGRLAIVFTETMNEQHRKGMDLNGNFGEDLFTPIEKGEVVAYADNKSPATSASVNFYDVSELTASDYELTFTGVNQFTITRLSDGRRFDMSEFKNITTDPDQTLGQGKVYEWEGSKLKVSLDGMTVHLDAGNGSYSPGDRYLVQPTRNGAQTMDTEITNPKLLALASPLRVEPASTNSGNAEIAAIEITNAKDTSALRSGQIVLPLEIVFNAPAEGSDVATFTVYDMSNPDAPVVFDGMEGLAYTPGEPIELQDYQVTLDNQPNPGDRFAIGRNTDGYSDNSNALAMSNFQSEALVNGFSYQDTYGQMLAKVGTQASNAEIAYSSSKAVQQSSENALQSVAGVNLDEEAANLVKYQQAYSAAAQLISAYQSIFDSLIGAVRS